MTDDLLKRFVRSDPTAVSEIYNEFGGAVFTVTMSILRDRGLAADAAQETFVKAWRNAGSFDASRPFGPWIYSIARRTAIDMLRGLHDSAKDLGGVEVGEIGTGLEQVWETFEVRRAIDRLPPEERAVVRLTHLDGFTHAEAAGRLDIPVGTVKSRSSRAHKRLAVWLRHMIED